MKGRFASLFCRTRRKTNPEYLIKQICCEGLLRRLLMGDKWWAINFAGEQIMLKKLFSSRQISAKLPASLIVCGQTRAANLGKTSELASDDENNAQKTRKSKY